jgi:DHA3 family macrolide efflux protein-like MFS transporter
MIDTIQNIVYAESAITIDNFKEDIMDINWKKNTVLFLIGQALSTFGTMIVQYAIIWHITLKTQSGTMMTLFTIAGFLPMFFISPFGGIWADRFNRKYIINISDGSIAFASLIVAVLIMSGFDHIGILFICAVIRSFGQGVQTPAVGAFIPQIVPQEHLTRINGLQSSIQSCITLTAPMISGALMSFASLEILFFLDVITAAVGISVLFFFVKTPMMAKSEPAENAKGVEYFHDLKEGMKYIHKQGYILRLIIFSGIFMFFASPSALLTPLQVTRNYGNDVWRLTAIEMAFSIGMTAGGILIGAWGGFKNRIFTIMFACVLLGIGALGLGMVHNFGIYIGIMAVIGLAMPLYNTPTMVLLQSTVDATYMGRVLSVFMMINSVMMPVGILFFGPLADKVSIDIILIGTGIVMMLLGIPFAASKTLREIGRRPA